MLLRWRGEAEDLEHTAKRKEPESEIPGFVIYIDEERFSMEEENGEYYIRPVKETEDSSFICEMEIREIKDASWEEAAQSARKSMCKEQEEGNWNFVSDILQDTDIERLYFNVSEGNEWDSMQEEHYFYPTGGQGAYHIVLRYFLEAQEGIGARFHEMLAAFASVAPFP